MMYLYLNVLDKKYQPGLKLIKKEHREEFQEEFAEYVAEVMQEQLIDAITKQRFKSKWKPLSYPYLQYKRKHHLSLKTWESTGLLKKSIKVYKRGHKYVIGIDKHRKYKGTKIKVYDVAKWMEYGSSTQSPRPLFRPILEYIRKNISRYWKKFLHEKGVI